MAEILLSLTIIGVVAAITLPSLTGNINERTWNTKRKALYARFSQAIALMPSLNGYGVGATDNDTISKATQTFVADGLAKVLKINNICDASHLSDCGIPEKFVDMGGGNHNSFMNNMTALNSMMTSVDLNPNDPSNPNIYNGLNTDAAAFETQNGESIAVYYNPYCRSDLDATTRLDGMQPKICANFIYDLNGAKGPNTVGKDIGFITVLYPADSVVVAPMPHVNAGKKGLSLEEGIKYCTSLDSEYRVPNKDEAAALFVNKYIIGNLPGGWLTTSSKGLENNVLKVWTQSTYTGNRVLTNGSAGADNYVRCVKR